MYEEKGKLIAEKKALFAKMDEMNATMEKIERER